MAAEENSLIGRARRLLQAYPAPLGIEMLVEGCGIRLSTNSQPLHDLLIDWYRDHLRDSLPKVDVEVALLEADEPSVNVPLQAYPPSFGKTRIKDEYCDFPDGRLLRKRLTGMQFLFGAGCDVAVGPCLANSNQAINFVNNRYTQWHLDRGYLLCHAAGVARHGWGVVMAGMPGSGKSTLALHAMDRDLDFVSNDRLMMKRTGGGLSMLGVPKLPRVNPGTILNNPRLLPLLSAEQRARFEALAPAALWQLEYKFDVDVNRLYGPRRMRLSANMAGAIILSWRRGGGAMQRRQVDLHERPELLAALMKETGVHYFRHGAAAGLDFSPVAYLAMLQDCPVLELSGGVDFPAAVEACVDLIGAGSPA